MLTRGPRGLPYRDAARVAFPLFRWRHCLSFHCFLLPTLRPFLRTNLNPVRLICLVLRRRSPRRLPGRNLRPTNDRLFLRIRCLFLTGRDGGTWGWNGGSKKNCEHAQAGDAKRRRLSLFALATACRLVLTMSRTCAHILANRSVPAKPFGKRVVLSFAHLASACSSSFRVDNSLSASVALASFASLHLEASRFTMTPSSPACLPSSMLLCFPSSPSSLSRLRSSPSVMFALVPAGLQSELCLSLSRLLVRCANTDVEAVL